jgi:hypothetical protein
VFLCVFDNKRNIFVPALSMHLNKYLQNLLVDFARGRLLVTTVGAPRGANIVS